MELDTLRVRLVADASDFSPTLKKAISDAQAAVSGITKTVNAARAGQQAVNRAAASAAREAKREQAELLRLAQRNDARIASHHLKTHLKAIDDIAKANAKAHADEIKAAQKRDKIIARNYVREQAAARKRIVDGAPDIGATFSSAGSTIKSVGAGITSAGRTASRYVTTPLAAAGAAGLAEFASFEDSINRAIAVAGGATAALRQQMVEAAKTIGSASITSAQDLAKTYETLAQAGLTLEQSTKALVAVNKFAVAGEMDLQQATEMLLQSTSALGLANADAVKNAQSLARVSDVLTKAAIVSTASIDDFAKALTNKAAAAAKMLNKDVEETVAVLAAYASTGLKAETAGERLYMVWRDLQTADLKNKNAWKDIGVAVYDASGKMRHTADIIGDLERAMLGLSDAQKKQTLAQLGVQDRSQAATLQLFGLSSAIRQYDADMRSATGETNRLAKEIETSFLSQLKIAWNQVRVIGIEIGELLAPAMRQLNNIVKQGLDSWRAMSPELKAAVVGLGAATAAIGPLLIAFGGIVTAVGTAVGTLGAVVVLAPEIAAAMAIATAAATALAGAFVFFGGEAALAWHKAADPAGHKALVASLEKGLHVAQRLLTAFVVWVEVHFSTMLTQAIAKAWYRAMVAQAKMLGNLMTASAQITTGLLRGKMPTLSDVFGKDVVAGASDPNFLNTAGKIIKEEYGTPKATIPQAKTEAPKAQPIATPHWPTISYSHLRPRLPSPVVGSTVAASVSSPTATPSVKIAPPPVGSKTNEQKQNEMLVLMKRQIAIQEALLDLNQAYSLRLAV